MTRALLTLLFCVISATFVSAQSSTGERKVNLRGNWKFILGDNMKFANPTHNDSDWEEIYVPAAWNHEGFSRYSGYAWYRTSFSLDFTLDESLYVELGRIDDVDEVYINGKLVGATGGMPPNYFTAYNVARRYLIPNEYLNNGKKNVIAVRVFDEGGEGGILGKNVAIVKYNTYDIGFQLAGNWKFRLSDDKEWSRPDYDDKSWDNITVPAAWENQGFREYDGFAWYRKTFQLPARFGSNDMVILMGRIDDMDQVFVNGKLVGETGDIEKRWARHEEHMKPRVYFIPDGLLKPGGANTIAVRVYDQVGAGGIYEGPVTITSRDKYRDLWKEYKYERQSDDGWWSILKYWDWE